MTPRPVAWLSRVHVPRDRRLGSLSRFFALLLFAVLLWLRFAHLGADPLPGLTWSGTLYTDEGFYAANAVAWARTGDWYIEGGFNSAVYLPVWTLLLRLSYAWLGVSMASTRAAAAVASLGVPLGTYLLLAGYGARRVGALAALILMLHYRLVGFSRLALAEMSMTALGLASLLLLIRGLRRSSLLSLCLSSALFVGALLTKTTALFFVPVLFVGAYLERPSRREGLMSAGVWLGTAAALLLVWNFWLVLPYRADHIWVRRELVGVKIAPLLLPLQGAPRRLLRFGYYVIKTLGPVWVISTCAALALYGSSARTIRGWRRWALWSSPPIVLSLVWAASLLGLLATSHYQPPRYIVPLVVPLAIVSAWLSLEVWRGRAGRLIGPLYSALLAGVMLWHGVSLVAYVARPEYSFRDLAQAVSQEMRTADREPFLLGMVGCNLALEIGYPAISEHLGLYDLEAKLLRYDPTHWVTVGEPDPDYLSVVEARYRLELVGTYELYRNYKGSPAHLYRLHPLAASP